MFWFRRVVLGRLKEISACVAIAAGVDARLKAPPPTNGVLARAGNDVAAAIHRRNTYAAGQGNRDAVWRAKRE